MTTAQPGSQRDPSWTDPSSWSAAVGAAGSAIRDDVGALLDRLAGPREVTARLVETPAAPADHDLDDVAVPAPPGPTDDGEPDFGRGATADAAPPPAGPSDRETGGGSDDSDHRGRQDGRGTTDEGSEDSGHDSWPYGTPEDHHDDGSRHDTGQGGGYDPDPDDAPDDPDDDLGDHSG